MQSFESSESFRSVIGWQIIVKSNTQVTYARIGLGFITLAAWLMTLWVTRASLLLRPTADDYCIGVRGGRGPIGGVVEDWQSWSGFLTPSFLTNTFVGLPLAFAPAWLASSMTFIAGAVGITFSSIVILKYVCLPRTTFRQLLLLALLVAPISATAWWTYLWAPSDLGDGELPNELALGLTHWQNLNAAYVVPTSVLLGVGVVILRPWIIRSWKSAFGALVTGLIVGLMGPTFAIAVVGFVILLALLVPFLNSRQALRFLRDLAILACSTMVGLAVALTAPGTLNRIRSVGSTPALFSPESVLQLVSTAFPESFVVVFDLTFSWGGFLTLCIGAGATSFASKLIPRGRFHLLLPTTILLFLFGLSLATVTLVTDALAYPAYWHFSSVAVVGFFSVFSLGGWLGWQVGRHSGISPSLIAIGLNVLAVGGIVGSSLALSMNAGYRFERWETGAAPTPGVLTDIEQTGWSDCWIELVRQNPRLGQGTDGERSS